MVQVLVPLADGCEELEAITIIDLLRRAEINVTTAGLDAGTVKASRGVTLVPDTTLDEALTQDYDMLVLPGGLPGADHLDQDHRIQHLLKNMAANGKLLAAICATPKVLASVGLPEDNCLQLQERKGDRVMMHLTMRAGRSNKAKQAFYAKVTENLAKDPGIDPANVLITIVENHDIDWSFGDGVASFIV